MLFFIPTPDSCLTDFLPDRFLTGLVIPGAFFFIRPGITGQLK